MRLEHYPQDLLKEKVKELVRKNVSGKNYKLFFFGSRVCGKGNERSDIDIGILGEEKIPLALMEQIKEDLDQLPILYSMDFVDFKTVSSDFKQVALSSTETIN